MMSDVVRLSRTNILGLARERIFSAGLNDLAASLSYENMVYGLGKIIYALNSTKNVFCVLGPDATITRSPKRWKAGFGYGGVIRWPKGYIFPEMRPNGCRTILARLNKLPSEQELAERILRVGESKIMLDGFKVKSNFGVGNHFFELYETLEVSPEIREEMPEDAYYAILHTAPQKEHKKYARFGKTAGSTVETPFGDIRLLEDKDAEKYYHLWREFAEFSRKRGERLATEILGECEIISNSLHQGLFSENEIRLGCFNTLDEDNRAKLFPITLRWDVPVYVFQGRGNLSKEIISRLGFMERAERLGLVEELEGINILPHGGGYRIDLPYSEINVIESEDKHGKRYFMMKGTGRQKLGGMMVVNPRELPYTYRGIEIVRKIRECNLAKPAAKLKPILTLKI